MLMKKETFDSVLRSTWQVVSKMYNKEAGKFESTMATGFALLSIDRGGYSIYDTWTKNGNGTNKSFKTS